MINEGVEKFKKLKEQAAEQIEKMKDDNTFNFNFESVDRFMFQDKDYREEKKKIQQALEDQISEQRKQNENLHTRRQRNAALHSMDMNKFHNQNRI